MVVKSNYARSGDGDVVPVVAYYVSSGPKAFRYEGARSRAATARGINNAPAARGFWTER